ncbi:MAG: hypothetical protein ACYTE8_02090 [Planctomycetota bacterium]|jgi:hypothetical protein
MKKSLKCAIISATCLVCSISAVFGQAPLNAGEDELSSIVPSDALFVLRVNQFETTLNQLDQFLAGTSPIGVSMLVRMQLAGFLGDPALNNVNMSGSFAVFAVENPQAAAVNPMLPPVALMGCIPITDFEGFVEQNPGCGEPDENGISTITSKDMMGNEKQMLITNVKSYGLVCAADCYEILSNLKKQLDVQPDSQTQIVPIADVLEAAEAQKAASEPIWFYFHLPELSDAFMSTASQQFEMMKMMAQQQVGNVQPSEGDADLIGMLGSFKYISAVLVPSSTHCVLKADIATKADSELAQVLDPANPVIQQMLVVINAQSPDQNPENLKRVSAVIADAGKMNYIGQYDLLSLFQLAAAMSGEVPEMELVSTSSLLYAIGFSEGLMDVQVAMPKEHFTEVFAASMAMQMGSMQPQFSQMPTMPPVSGDINIPASLTDAAAQPVSISGSVTAPQPVSASEPVIVINGLQFGMTAETMIEILGPPKTTTGNIYYYFDTGLTIVTSTVGQVDQIICGSVNPQSPLVSGCPYRTKQDLAIGSTRQEVEDVYGRPSSVVNNPIGKNAQTIEYKDINARFTLVDDKVVQMVFKAPN